MNASKVDLANSDSKDLEVFWAEIDVILALPEDVVVEDDENGPIWSTPRVDADLVQDRMSRFFAHCVEYYETHLQQSANGDNVLARLVESPLFTHAYIVDVTETLIKLVVAAKTLPTLHILFDALLVLGRDKSEVYRSKMVATQLIPRLVHHIWAARYAEEYLVKGSAERGGNGEEGGWSLDWNIKYVRAKSMGNPDKQIEEARDRLLQCRLREESVVLLYEVCRAQRLELKDMRAIDAAFVDHLFELVEASRHWNDDSYNYQLIKLIVALNEQFMVSSIENTSQKGPSSRKASATQSNIVMTVLRFRLNASNTFAENLIWMLNRASSFNAEDVCMQLLVLKLLYLLFTTKETAHYFYLNDLKVLVDVFIRELSDLPEESESLRNTYLRVLHPLLTATQLLTYPYKRVEIRGLLLRLTSHAHLRDISSTTKRLVDRCLNAQWCVDLNAGQKPQEEGRPKKVGSDDAKNVVTRSAAVSPSPAKGHPSKYLHQLSQDADTDEESASKWSDGSGSSSWQMGMVGDERPPMQNRSQSAREAVVWHGSPLSRDSTDHYFNLAAVQEVMVGEGQNAVPILQVQTVHDEERILQLASVGEEGSSNSSTSTGSNGHGRRRRPPAPPMSDNGLFVRKERKPALLSSTSETHLPSTNTDCALVDSPQEGSTKEMTSMPNSPRIESFVSSREPSPTMESLPTSRRRRPPPPPVNRATKGFKFSGQQLQPTLLTKSSSQTEHNQSYYTNDATTANTQHIEKAIDHLYFSEGGYGW